MLNDSKSKWIWLDNNTDKKDQTVYIRKDVVWKSENAKMKLHITASNRYKAFINGRSLGIGPCPGDPNLYYYDTYDIELTSEELKSKQLCLSAICYNMGESVTVITEQNKGKPGFRCLFEIYGETTDGIYKTDFIGSDESFKVIASPVKPGDFVSFDESRISKWSGFKEVYDSRNEPLGWKNTDFNDESWQNAVIVNETAKQIEKLTAREIPFMTDYHVYPVSILQTENYLGKISFPECLLKQKDDTKNEDFVVTTIDASVPGSFPAIVLDFGKEVVGYPSYTLKGMSGANVSFWYGESLDLNRYDTVILNGDVVTYQPYQIRAFRYLKIVCNNSLIPIEIYSVSLRMWRYPYEDTGRFECSDDLLNKIWETSTYTVKMNSLEHFVDCPLREQAQWLADSRVMAMANYWNFYSPNLVRKAIRQFLAVQSEDGLIPATGPQNCTLSNLDFPCHFFMMVYEYYFYSGDLEFMEEVYPRLGNLLSYFIAKENENGFVIDSGGKGLFLDWAFIDKREEVTALQCLYYQALDSYEKITSVLGYTDKIDGIHSRKEKLKRKINELLFNKEIGLYCDCRVSGVFSQHYSQQSTAYALVTGVADSESVPALIEKMYTEKGIEQIKGAFLLSFVTAMLFGNDKGEKSIDIISDYWGEMLKRGATTWWETFDRSTPSCTVAYCFAGNSPTYLIDYIPTSQCHAWGSGPAYTLMSNILGVIPADVGFKKIRISPATGNLKWCNGSVPTKYGVIEAKWKKLQSGEIEYEIINLPKEIEIISSCENLKIILKNN